jgi:hypothetical protein
MEQGGNSPRHMQCVKLLLNLVIFYSFGVEISKLSNTKIVLTLNNFEFRNVQRKLKKYAKKAKHSRQDIFIQSHQKCLKNTTLHSSLS